MKLSRKSSLARVAAHVSDALTRAGIRAVLTGGACATLYSHGAYESYDLDFIVQSAVSTQRLDQVMRGIGFRRRGIHYAHAETPFIVEFPAGPLGVGSDLKIRSVAFRVGRTEIPALSATDSCRDRLAAFYHWDDRQSLMAAVAIARRHKVSLDTIRRWSRTEGAATEFREFLRLLGPRRGRASSSGGVPSSRPPK